MGQHTVRDQRVTELEFIMEKLGMVPLEGEGGMYRRNYEGAAGQDGRPVYSSIYYLLTPNSFSHMHRLSSDEIYHFYMGDSLEILLLYPDGQWELRRLGTKLSEGEVPQLLVPAGVWQGSKVAEGGSYSLVGTTMAPAYADEDYEHGSSEELCKQYPEAAEKIMARCGAAVAR